MTTSNSVSISLPRPVWNFIISRLPTKMAMVLKLKIAESDLTVKISKIKAQLTRAQASVGQVEAEPETRIH